jgi:murein DD-endopeptidase MepM/ murein hydrolase activator NlpD
MTLYGHLSTIGVKVGDQVSRGQEIGRTGTTGLATGDHLHYEVLVHGVSVTPLEWWDAKWIQDRIIGPMQTAGLIQPADTTTRDRPSASPPTSKPSARTTR